MSSFVCLTACKPEVSCEHLPPLSSSTWYFEAGSLTESGADWWGKNWSSSSNGSSVSASLGRSFSLARVRMHQHIHLSHGHWDVNSGPHACSASIFSIEVTSRPTLWVILTSLGVSWASPLPLTKGVFQSGENSYVTGTNSPCTLGNSSPSRSKLWTLEQCRRCIAWEEAKAKKVKTETSADEEVSSHYHH